MADWLGVDVIKRTCVIDGCTSPAIGRGWCSKHYYRWKRNGDPLATTRAPHGSSLDARLRFTGWDEVVRVPALGPCWEWRGSIRNGDGYGATSRPGGGNMLAHRAAFVAWVGPLSDDLILLHACDNPPCINPAHLRAGTDADNSADKIARGREARGERSGAVKVTDAVVDEIRARYAAGGCTYRSLAGAYGLSKSHIGAIVTRRKRKLPT